MCTALEISKYILQYCKNNKISNCSNKKLQKLLYYVQAWSLAFRDKKLFNDKIEAWLHGPVVSEVYHKYKEFGFDPIMPDMKKFDSKCLSDDDKELIDAVLNGYAKYDAEYLEMRTHIETPWQEARNTKSKVITLDSMKKYYKSVLENEKKENQ